MSSKTRYDSRDPRFQAQSGDLNTGMMTKSYEFITDMQRERFYELKTTLKEARKNEEDQETITRIKNLIGEEKKLRNKQRTMRIDQQQKSELKTENKERVEKGLEPKFLKKRGFKELELKKKFDKLEASGGTAKFLEK